jgi:hypothetical protein
VDLVALAVTLLMLAALLVPGDGDLPGRPAMALLVVAFAPGWAVLRLLGAPVDPLSVLGAVALSVSLAMLTSLITVAWLDWRWYALAVAWMLATSCVLAAVIARPHPRRDIADGGFDPYSGTQQLPWNVTQPHWRSEWTTDDDAQDDAAVDARADWVPWLVTLAGLLVCGITVAVADPGDIDGYGLVAAVPPLFYAGIGLLVAALFAQLGTGGRRGHIGATVNLGCLIVMLHGLPGFVEPEPRFPVAWLHAGFANQIAYEGELLPRLDARFSWAGFFSGAAFLQRVADTDDLFWILRFAPVVLNAMAALAVYVLARALQTSISRSIAAATIFVFANWIGQDYFAPQAFGFVLVITIVAAVLTFFPDVPRSDGRVVRMFGSPGMQPSALTGDAGALVYFGCLFLAAGLIASHQLSPPMLVAMLVSLALLGRIRTKLLGAIVGLGFVVWMSHAAESYWVGHLDDVFGQVGDVSGVLSSNVSQRAGPGSPARELVVRSRMVLMLGVWCAAGLAMLGQRRRRALDPALATLFLAPFAVLALQSYGGEVLLRVALFTLPGASILLARTEFPMRVADRVHLPRLAVPVVALTLVTPLFVLARYGNESYEQVIPDDRAVVEDMYGLVPDESEVYVVNRSTMMYSERLTGVRFRDLSSDPVTAQQMLDAADTDENPAYVLVTDGQEGYRHEVQGATPEWLSEFASRLLASGSFRIVSQHGESMLLEHVGGA